MNLPGDKASGNGSSGQTSSFQRLEPEHNQGIYFIAWEEIFSIPAKQNFIVVAMFPIPYFQNGSFYCISLSYFTILY